MARNASASSLFYLQAVLHVICTMGLCSLTLSVLYFFPLSPPHGAPKAPSRALPKHPEASLFSVYCPSAGSGNQGQGWGYPAQTTGLYSVCKGAARPFQGNARSGMSRSR
jgi:hypothetical protein